MAKRKTKAQWEAEVDALRQCIGVLLSSGGMANNVCYNLAQREGAVLSERNCESMRASYQEWDRACRRVREMQRSGAEGGE